jgi:hypothetical protein
MYHHGFWGNVTVTEELVLQIEALRMQLTPRACVSSDKDDYLASDDQPDDTSDEQLDQCFDAELMAGEDPEAFRFFLNLLGTPFVPFFALFQIDSTGSYAVVLPLLETDRPPIFTQRAEGQSGIDAWLIVCIVCSVALCGAMGLYYHKSAAARPTADDFKAHKFAMMPSSSYVPPPARD